MLSHTHRVHSPGTSFDSCRAQHILRLLNTNVDGKRKVMYALTEIKGVGRRYSNLVCKKADVDLNKRCVARTCVPPNPSTHTHMTCAFHSAGELNSDELERLVTIIQNPTQYKIPLWFLNRQRDIIDGKNSQILSNAVDSKLRDDLERLKKIRAHRGLRHYWGLRVRGQHTKTTGALHDSVACAPMADLASALFVQVVAVRPSVCRRSVVKLLVYPGCMWCSACEISSPKSSSLSTRFRRRYDRVRVCMPRPWAQCDEHGPCYSSCTHVFHVSLCRQGRPDGAQWHDEPALVAQRDAETGRGACERRSRRFSRRRVDQPQRAAHTLCILLPPRAAPGPPPSWSIFSLCT